MLFLKTRMTGKYSITLSEKCRMQKYAYIMTLIMHINLVIYSLFISWKVLETIWINTPVHPPHPHLGNLEADILKCS